MSSFIIWCVIIFFIIIINKSNKKKATTPNTTNNNTGNTSHTQPVQTQKPAQRTTNTTSTTSSRSTTSSAPNKSTMAQKKKQLQEHFGMPSGRIHDEIHNETHVHDDNSTLCRANINNDNPESGVNIGDNPSVLPDTETLIVCGYNGQEFLDSLQNEFNKKFPV